MKKSHKWGGLTDKKKNNNLFEFFNRSWPSLRVL